MYQDNLLRELIIDNFAGGGGASTGIELALGVPVDIAINHDADAIAMHKANHPYTTHYQEDVFAIEPEKVTGGRPVGIAWFSPDCKHFSRAKGGAPVEKKIRGLSWVIIKWAMSKSAPRCIFMENVPEIQTWCPLVEVDGKMRPDVTREGETFKGFISILTTGIEKEHPAFLECCEFLKISPDSEQAERLIKGLGYKVEYRELKACDYGAPTIRKRFYLIARNDGLPIVFPTPTHGKGKLPYRTAAECIDFSLPCPSIFGRKKDLAINTQKRIARGLDKFVIKNKTPFIMQVNYDNAPQDVEKPISTITAVNKHYLAKPTLSPYIMSNNTNNAPHGAKEPLPTVTTGVRNFVCSAYLSKYFSGEKQAGATMENPMPTVTGIDHNALVAVNLSCRYGNGNDGRGSEMQKPTPTVTPTDHNYLMESHLCILRKNMDCKSAEEPIPTITSKASHEALIKTYLCKIDGAQDLKNWDKVRHLLNSYAGYNIAPDEVLILEINGSQYFISDIGMRMLKPHELMLAQGFPADYVLDIETHIGKKYSTAKQIARMGNAVCPPVATALIRANCAEMIVARKVISTMAMLELEYRNTVERTTRNYVRMV